MPDVGSWHSLLDVTREARQIRAEQASAPEVACPRDGEPLRTSVRGVLHCSYDGYRTGGGC